MRGGGRALSTRRAAPAGEVRRRLPVVLVVAGALALCCAGVAPDSAAAGVACADADLTVATGIVMGCAVAEAPSTPNAPQAGTRSYTVTIDLDAPGVEPRVVMANDRVLQPVPTQLTTPVPEVDEIVSSMADRTGAVVGINGGFFNIFQGSQGGQPARPYTGAICGGAVIDGEIWKSPPQSQVVGETPQLITALYVTDDGAMAIDQVGFSGSVSVGAEVQPLASVNDIASAVPSPRCPVGFTGGEVSDGDGIALLTPRIGATVLNAGPPGEPGYAVPDSRQVTLVSLAPVPGTADAYSVLASETRLGLTAIPTIPDGQVMLLESAPATDGVATWLSRNAAVGATVTIDTGLTLGAAALSGVRTLIGGVAQIVEDGVPVTAPVGFVPPSGGERHAETVVGLDATGRQVTVTVFDRSEGSAGVWWDEAAEAVAAQGVEQAILFDGGGSTTLVAQLGAAGGPVTVVNTPEGDNVLNGPFLQRYVGDGLFFSGVLPTPVPAPAPVLPVTGAADMAAPVALAGGALLIAGLALVASRRSRSHRVSRAGAVHWSVGARAVRRTLSVQHHTPHPLAAVPHVCGALRPDIPSPKDHPSP